MRLTTRVMLGFGLMWCIAAAAHLYQVSLLDRLQQLDLRQTRLGIQTSLVLLRTRTAAAEMEEFAEKFQVSSDSIYREGLEQLISNVSRELTNLDRTLEAPSVAPLERSAFELEQAAGSLQIAWSRLDRLLNQLLEGDVSTAQEDELDRTFQLFFATLEEGIQAGERFLEESAAFSDRTRRDVRRVSTMVLAASLLLAVAVPLLVHRSISSSIRELATATRRIAGGDFSVTVKTHGGDELAEFGKLLNDMVRRLSELDQLKKDFVSGVSHDLRAPLVSIQETTRLLLDGEEGEQLTETQRRLLRLNLEAAERLSRMIGDLLDLSRLEAGAVAFEFVQVDSAALLNQAAAAVESVIGGRDVHLEVRVQRPAPAVWVDRIRMMQALTNVLTNAVEFSPPGEVVQIAVDRIEAVQPVSPRARRVPGPPFCRIRVSDRGPGIPEQYRERVFDRFFSADPKGIRSRKGTGLGLALTQHIIEAHGGAVWVEDGPDGRGSQFCILLPAIRPQ